MPETPTPTLRPGDKVLHPFNRELGPGVVRDAGTHRLTVHFPRSDQTLVFAAAGHPLVALELPPGVHPDRWAEDFQDDLVSRLARSDTDGWAAFRLRLAALELAQLREADGLGSFLGGRIEIFPHQLHVAEQAVRTDPVRWLLADEVGLGKTVEACLILNRLLRTGRAERVLIVAPASLTVQWLGELYRKFHQIFVLLDEERRKDVRKDFGPEWNPFEVHPRSVIALEDLVRESDLVRRAEAAKPDLLVVDEAHHLERRAGHPGSLSYRAVAPLAAASRNVLLLSATPLEADAHGFFRLLELLRPDEYGSWEEFRAHLDAGTPLYPCTSATRRADIGGLPPRVPTPVDLAPWPEMEAIEEAVLTEPAADRLAEIRRAERLERALDAPTGDDDPRLLWVIDQYPAWKKAGDKILLFVARRESLEFLKGAIERATLQRVGVFHEDLTPAARDLEVAQFAQADGPTLLISTESGGEGRNFEFCRCLVLFDLPWDPVLLEQRIGRLDRISRTRPVEVCYFRPAGGLAAQIARLYETLGIFREPLGGLDRSLHHVEEAIRRATHAHPPRLDVEAVVRETHEARARMNRALYHDLHRNRYRPELAPGILARIPADLERRTAEVVLEACGQFGFETVPKGGRATWYIEFGSEAVVESIPGVTEGTRWLGTFDRDEAVQRETLDFFASGHPLVEAIVAELADGTHGRVALLEIPGHPSDDTGVLVAERRGSLFRLRAFDLDGMEQPAWVDAALRPPGEVREIPAGLWDVPGWAERIRVLFASLPLDGEIAAACGLRLRRKDVAAPPPTA